MIHAGRDQASPWKRVVGRGRRIASIWLTDDAHPRLRLKTGYRMSLGGMPSRSVACFLAVHGDASDAMPPQIGF